MRSESVVVVVAVGRNVVVFRFADANGRSVTVRRSEADRRPIARGWGAEGARPQTLIEI